MLPPLWAIGWELTLPGFPGGFCVLGRGGGISAVWRGVENASAVSFFKKKFFAFFGGGVTKFFWGGFPPLKWPPGNPVYSKKESSVIISDSSSKRCSAQADLPESMKPCAETLACEDVLTFHLETRRKQLNLCLLYSKTMKIRNLYSSYSSHQIACTCSCSVPTLVEGNSRKSNPCKNWKLKKKKKKEAKHDHKR